jgi:hypothetical protein
MQLKIVFHNVRRLNDLSTVQKCWLYYKDQFFNIETMLIEEHKLQREKAKCIGNQLWCNSRG